MKIADPRPSTGGSQSGLPQDHPAPGSDPDFLSGLTIPAYVVQTEKIGLVKGYICYNHRVFCVGLLVIYLNEIQRGFSV